MVGEPQGFEQVACAFAHLSRGEAAELAHRDLDVRPNAELRQQKMELKDKAEHREPEARPLSLA